MSTNVPALAERNLPVAEGGLLSQMHAVGRMAPRQILALTDLPSHLKVETGTAWHGCRLALPDLGPLSVDLGVVRVIESPASRGTVARRVGAQFLKLPDGTRAQVQRYINRLEREQLAK